MTTYNISDLKTPADFTAALTVSHIQDLRDRLIAALGREDIEVFVDADDGGDVPSDPTENVSSRLIHLRIGYKGRDPDEPTDKGVWDILVAIPHEDNCWDTWTNSYVLQITDIDQDVLEEVSVENGNPRMYETFAERIQFWLPKL